MGSSRAKRRSRKPQRTHHKKAFTNSQTVELLSYLRKHWKILDGIDRGDRLQTLVEAGCTRRGLADDLRQSPTTIGRHIELASLSNNVRTSVRQGTSAKKALNQNAIQKHRSRIRRMLAAEKASGSVSDHAAQVVAQLLLDRKQKLRISEGYVAQLFLEVDFKFRYPWLAWTGMQSLPVRISDPSKIIRYCRPRPKSKDRQGFRFDVRPEVDALANFDLLAEWVARIADALTQEATIRDRALIKAEKLVAEGFKERRPRAIWTRPVTKWFGG